MTRVETAARECPPEERPAMLRRWLAALRAREPAAASDGGRSPSSPSTPPSTPPATAAACGGADVATSPTSAGGEWASLSLAAAERRDAARAGGEQDAARVGGLVDRADDRVYASTFDDDGDGADDDVDDDDGGGGEKKTLRAQPLIFRDVLLRSRALESLATSYAMRAPADAVETSLLTEVFASLCAGGERVAAALARGVIEARPVACAGPPATAFAPRAPFLEDMPFLTFLPARASFLDSIPTHRDASRLHLTRPELRRPDATSLRAGKPPADFSRDVEARGDGAAEVRSIHWSPYYHVGVVNAVP